MENLTSGNITNLTTALINDMPVTTNSQPPYVESVLQDIVINANRYLLPIIIATGFLGNIVSYIVFVFTNLKRISTSVYLAALSVSDTGFLICVLIGWFDNMGFPFFHNQGICQIVVYMTFVFSFTSVWFVFAFTCEMYICVFHPSKSAKVCQLSFARKMVLLITGFAALFYIFSFWTADVSYMKCQFIHHAETMMILSILDTFLTLIFPFSLIIFMITRLLFDISKLYKSEDTENSLSDGTGRYSSDMAQSSQNEPMIVETSFSTTDQHFHESPQRRRGSTTRSVKSQGTRAQTKIKRMLVVVVMVFLLMNLPSHAIRVQFFIRSLIDPKYRSSTNEFLIQQILQILYYLNFAINFVLYSACGKTFRIALLNFFESIGKTNCGRAVCQRISWLFFRKKNSADTDCVNQQHSRLVDIHLSAIQLSQIPSFDAAYVCRSPPCLLSPDSTVN